eukprot:TRINITY_DN51_c0_g1_i1.p1 TRINITY_DN51_c0_g1~~TRINITY_DN51_c0_g1_i1.p1  ORF type:complete len:205 (+),score=39.48 TRINITY_DN51_c0_g1_i1:429-1043(+)
MNTLWSGISGASGVSPAPTGNQPTQPEVNPEALQKLVDMGFPEERCKKALLLNRMNPNLAMEWLLEHHEDPDVDTPLPSSPSTTGPPAPFTPDPVVLQQLEDMGFPKDESIEALKATNNNQEAACAWLLGERDEDHGQSEESNPVVRSILNHPAIQAGLANPRVLRAFQMMVENPSTASQFISDPEIGPILLQVHAILNAHAST